MRSWIPAIVLGAAILTGGYAAQPSFSGDCTVSNRSEWAWTECDYGTLITVTEEEWVCNQPLANFGPLPIKVVVQADESYSGNGGELNNACDGVAGDDINLIIEIQGNGALGAFGPSDDAFKFKPLGQEGPANIRMTGSINCGPRIIGEEHSDAFQNQALLGTPMKMVNMVSGDYDGGLSTCQGAGGVIFWSEDGNIDILGGKFIGCNHSLNGGAGSPPHGAGSTVTDASFRSGRNNDGDPNCDFSGSPPCEHTTGMTLTDVVCQDWNATTNEWDDVPPDP